MEGRTHYRSVEVKFRSESEKRTIIEYYLSHNLTKQEVWYKFTGKPKEHGLMNTWMKKLGYQDYRSAKKLSLKTMSRNRIIKTKEKSLTVNEQVRQLELRLKEAELKAEAFSKMIDIAEEEFNIPIRKKLNSKP